MATDHIPSTLSFLTDAAHLLAFASPETSAHLMSQRNSFMFNNDLDQPDVQRQRVCGCCGHIMIVGYGDLLGIDSSKIARRNKRKSSSSGQKAKERPPRSGCRKTLTCEKCGRYTTINLPPPARVPKRRLNQVLRAAPMAVGASEATASSSRSTSAPRAGALSSEPAKTTANASSKKRAKNRKQGLQALLQQTSNSKPQAGLGLSLADFMQN
ncbi:hypothetical protein O1611_g8118 [Lasiodiplodia mahajangana]|uniref:Uncharacterized protein n=1 Tax=Lasiodiplodia mahajangana TaxID=1108764 RepID=A0ACC2JDG4_9PEZI|nr:hypothetical protein O1611_g8118 [Lasiodiplodia mahajangana]